MKTHWTVPYLGRPWARGEWECTDLVAAVVADLGGPVLRLPRPARGRRARGRQVNAHRHLFRAASTPAEGDVALLYSRLGWHVGVGVAQPEGMALLHVVEDGGTVIDALGDVARVGILEGWYRWR